MSRSIQGSEILKLLNDAQIGRYKFTPSPEDWRDHWIYFLITDRFNNTVAPPREQWNAPVGTFQGGTFNGIREQLDYLKDLGVGALWVSPVLKNPQYDAFAHHGYGIQDFLSIEPRFSSDIERARREPEFAAAELRELVDDAHAHGIYVIFDIVLNHVGNVFAYEGDRNDAPWRDDMPYRIMWRDAQGHAVAEWSTPPAVAGISSDALIWPIEMQRNEYYRRMGNAFTRPLEFQEQAGDFYSLKELNTAYLEAHPVYGISHPVRAILISAYQYLMARFDIDGFRIDTLKYLEPDFASEFGSAMREYALTIGKKNFFTYGEVYDAEEKIARFIGRNANADGDLIGVDAALDFPLFFKLPAVIKGQIAPTEIASMFLQRRHLTQALISSQGEASGYFVTFLDNHDQNNRIRYVDQADPHRYDDQVTLALACQFTLQGIPSLYYGTEQGLSGSGDRPEYVREALWGKENAFDQHHPFYRTIRQLSDLRANLTVLRYGRQYFREVSGDGVSFGISYYPKGIMAYSRVLADLEAVVVANTNLESGWSGKVVVDYTMLPGEYSFSLLFSN
ncbi:MAG: alpha-amylase, partial [Blastocatellia bacterium]|nr:alpha-amylase [Blastocatellia bacterium]